MGRIGSQDGSITYDYHSDSRKIGLNHKIEDMSRKWTMLRPQLFVSLTTAFGSLIVGFSCAYSAPALVSMSRPQSKLHPTVEEKSWIISLLPLFASLGGLIGGWLMSALGRKKVIFLHGFPYIVSFAMIVMAQNLAMLMVGRAIMGLCIGISTLVFPVYLGETMEPRYRGVLGLFPSILGNAGVLISYSAGMFLDWPKLALLGAILALPLIIGSYILPETPRWYTNKGKLKEAISALQWLRGRKNTQDEFNEINASVNTKENTKSRSSDMFKIHYIKPLLICLFLMFFQQTSGINAIIFYSFDIFGESGSNIDSNIQSIVLAVVNVIATTAATMLIDRLGRKILLYMSCIVMSMTLFMLGFYFRSRNGQEALEASLNLDHESAITLKSYSWLPLLNLVIYIIGFSIGFGPIPWLIMGEILPARIRGRAASITTSFNWLCSFIITKTFGTMIIKLGSDKTFWLFGASCILAIIFIFFLVPETKGKSLKDIEKIFLPNRKNTRQNGISKDNTNTMTNLPTSKINSNTGIKSGESFSKEYSLMSSTNKDEDCNYSKESKEKSYNSEQDSEYKYSKERKVKSCCCKCVNHMTGFTTTDFHLGSIRKKIKKFHCTVDQLSGSLNNEECLNKYYTRWKLRKSRLICKLDKQNSSDSDNTSGSTQGNGNQRTYHQEKSSETDHCKSIDDTSDTKKSVEKMSKLMTRETSALSHVHSRNDKIKEQNSQKEKYKKQLLCDMSGERMIKEYTADSSQSIASTKKGKNIQTQTSKDQCSLERENNDSNKKELQWIDVLNYKTTNSNEKKVVTNRSKDHLKRFSQIHFCNKIERLKHIVYYQNLNNKFEKKEIEKKNVSCSDVQVNKSAIKLKKNSKKQIDREPICFGEVGIQKIISDKGSQINKNKRYRIFNDIAIKQETYSDDDPEEKGTYNIKQYYNKKEINIAEASDGTKTKGHHNLKIVSNTEKTQTKSSVIRNDNRKNSPKKKKQKSRNVSNSNTSDKDTEESNNYKEKKKVKKRNTLFNINRRTKQDDKSSKQY